MPKPVRELTKIKDLYEPRGGYGTQLISVLRMISKSGAEGWSAYRDYTGLVRAGLATEIGAGKRDWFPPFSVVHKYKATERGSAVVFFDKETEAKLLEAREAITSERGETTFEQAFERVQRNKMQPLVERQ